jgi:putative DNA primase/helicase
VFPVYGPFKKGQCQCQDGRNCRSPAKHPIGRFVKNGHNDATVDDATVEQWWHAWPRANIGLAVPKGYVVLDIDGLDGLEAIERQGWRIPETVTAATARGWHHWFEAEVEIRPGAHFMEHVDMRGPGGYVIAPPSLHVSGTQYEWERAPTEIRFAPAPPWIYELVRRAREDHRRAPLPSADEPIVDGGRNVTLARIAGAMRRYGCSENAIVQALMVTNAERCRPMLEDREVQTIAWSVARYQPAAICMSTRTP